MGLDRMGWSIPGALFLAAGGYHHHLGTNTWVGPNAKPASEDEVRMLEWTLDLPAAGELDALEQSLARGGYASDRKGSELVAHDPWGITVRARGAA
jgi:catechol 2,3-dioxygenase